VKALAIAATDLRRLLRWRANVFFLFLLPMLIILLLGAAFGGSSARIGVVGGSDPLAHRLVARLDAQRSVQVERFDGERALDRAVARGRIDAGLVVPADYDQRVRAGDPARVRYFARPDSVAQQLSATVQAVAAHEGALLGAAQLAARERGGAFRDALAKASATAARVPRVSVALTKPDGSPYPRSEDRFASGASTQLLLFVFLNSLNGAVWLIETRRLGIARRMLSTPTSPRSILGGILLGRLAIALLQALIIVVGSSLFFSVGWGDPLGSAAVVLAFCLVGTGAGMLLGALCSTEQQAGPIALLLGLSLAAFGGSMVPLEVFPSSVRAVAHITPHAWANDAFSELLEHGGGLVDVLPQVAVLLAFAGVAVTLATWRLRRVVVGA
jgi:linearmycin/streptolysin S transport system permease protein